MKTSKQIKKTTVVEATGEESPPQDSLRTPPSKKNAGHPPDGLVAKYFLGNHPSLTREYIRLRAREEGTNGEEMFRRFAEQPPNATEMTDYVRLKARDIQSTLTKRIQDTPAPAGAAMVPMDRMTSLEMAYQRQTRELNAAIGLTAILAEQMLGMTKSAEEAEQK